MHTIDRNDGPDPGRNLGIRETPQPYVFLMDADVEVQTETIQRLRRAMAADPAIKVGSPIVVHGIKETLDILRAHLFNWKIWPDFTQIPDAEKPFMVYREIRVGEPVEIRGRRFTPIPANHTVPAVGYLMDNGRNALIFSGDTSTNDALWKVVNKTPNLKYLIIETAFCNRERDIAVASKHLCPQMLAEELEKMRASPEVYITHLKPGEGALTMREVSQAAGRWRPRMLENNQEFSL